MTKKREVAFGLALVGAAAFALGMAQIHRELQEMNRHLEAIEAHAAGQHVEAMSQLEEGVGEQT